jgi:hypothetical protein
MAGDGSEQAMMGAVAVFLSDEWVEQLEGAARADGSVAALGGVTLTLQQVVTGAPDGDVAWHVRVADGDVHVGRGHAPGADVVITESYEVARAVSRGELSAGEALAAGRLQLEGAVSLLVTHRDALAHVQDMLAAVHERTTYP